MGREVRRVPKNWRHPQDSAGRFVPLFDGDYETACLEYARGVVLWEAGAHPSQPCDYCRFYWQYFGGPPPQPPARGSRMYETPREDLTHYQLYETTSEGTPLGPVFETLDALCEWAAGNASTFASFTATAAEWRRMLDADFVYAEQDTASGKVMFL